MSFWRIFSRDRSTHPRLTDCLSVLDWLYIYIYILALINALVARLNSLALSERACQPIIVHHCSSVERYNYCVIMDCSYKIIRSLFVRGLRAVILSAILVLVVTRRTRYYTFRSVCVTYPRLLLICLSRVASCEFTKWFIQYMLRARSLTCSMSYRGDVNCVSILHTWFLLTFEYYKYSDSLQCIFIPL